MTIDVYTTSGEKKGTATLSKTIFEAPINEGLMHQAVVRQQSNRRKPIAHVKSRGEVRGSTAKLFRQKGTGRARRGSIRAPLLRGGGKAFGPRNTASFIKDMPRKMRRIALFSCLSLKAKGKAIIGLSGSVSDIKTKKVHDMLKKMPVEIGRRILIVIPSGDLNLQLSARNIPNVKVIQAPYLNAEDVLTATNIIFHTDALTKLDEVFGGSTEEPKKEAEPKAEAKESTKSAK